MKVVLDGITKTYLPAGGVGPPVTAVNAVSVTIGSGEFLCVLGPSGCGKSTLLRLVASVESPDTGSVLIDDRPAGPPGLDRFLIFQDSDQLFFWKTALGNVAVPLQLAGEPQWRREAITLLERVGLGNATERYPSELSVGMRQRVAIARGLAARPQLLLMDEPFASVDAAARLGLQRLVIDLWRDTGVTILFVTHDIHEAVLLSDRIAVMGRSGTIHSVWDNPHPRPRDPAGLGDSELARELFGIIESGGER